MIAREFKDPAVAILKHNNPCGCATAETLSEAFLNAYAGDPVSAFGSIIGINCKLDVATAEKMCEPNRFIEAIIAPDYDPLAIEILTTKPKWKKNVRIMRSPEMLTMNLKEMDYRRVTGGLLMQERDIQEEDEATWVIPTKRQPTVAELADLKFAWKVCKHVKSNAIVYVKNKMIVGVGAGQMSRLDSCDIASRKSEGRSLGGVVASGCLLPFS